MVPAERPAMVSTSAGGSRAWFSVIEEVGGVVGGSHCLEVEEGEVT